MGFLFLRAPHERGQGGLLPSPRPSSPAAAASLPPGTFGKRAVESTRRNGKVLGNGRGQGADGCPSSRSARPFRGRTGEMTPATEAFGSSGAGCRRMFKEKRKSKPILQRGLGVWHEESFFFSNRCSHVNFMCLYSPSQSFMGRGGERCPGNPRPSLSPRR